MKLIDLSEWNGDVNFSKLKSAGVDGVILRIGFGREISQKDRKFETYYNAAKRYGLLIGGYFFSYSAYNVKNDFENEAYNCINMIKDRKFDLPIFYDIEWEGLFNYSIPQLTQGIKRFCEIVTSYGFRAGLYTGCYIAQNLINLAAIYPKYYFWLADWSNKAHLACDIWQYSESGQVEGISGNVDMNRVIDNRVVGKLDYTHITRCNCYLRSKAFCGGDSEIITTISKGQTVEVIEDDNYGWSKIKYKDKIGYVQNTKLNDNLYLSSYPLMTVNVREGLNVRKTPNGKIIDVLPNGKKVKVRYIIESGKDNGWAEVAYPTKDSVSYVYAEYLRY